MHIAVIGAGVIGVTTAYALVRRGHRVTVVERLPDAGLETSRANAGQRSYGYVYPWASPAMIKKALPWLIKPTGPLKMRIPPSPQALRFLIATWRFATSPGLFEANKRDMLRLGAYSRECFEALEQDSALKFDGGHGGLIQLASDSASLESLEDSAALLERLGIDYQWLTPEKVRELEPGLTGNAPVFGALRLTGDGTGDCHQFTQSLAARCRALGVVFRFGTEVADVDVESDRISGLTLKPADQLDEKVERLEADTFVLCAGVQSRALGDVVGEKLPIYPIKGYSLTAPLIDPGRAPRSTVIDDHYKVAATRLGDRLRATGFVELADMDRRIPESRLNTIRTAIASRFPGAADLDRAEPWTGFRPMTPDGPPVIGASKRENLYLNTGHGTFGWTLCAASAELIAQLINGEEPAIALEPFRAGRF